MSVDFNPDTPAGITPELLTTAEAARLVNVGERTLWRWSRAGIAPAPVHIGGAVRYRARSTWHGFKPAARGLTTGGLAGDKADA